MTIGEHLTQFAGLRVRNYSAEDGLTSPTKEAPRISLDWDAKESFADVFAKLIAEPNAPDVQALIIGDWGEAGTGNDSAPVVEALVSARDRLPKLRALFLGEMVVEESEISWINQSDVSPIFEAFSNLEELHLRGGNGLSLGRPRHLRLRKLVIETGGMPSTVVHEVASAELPQLEHLELWLGDDGYGNDVSPDDLRQLLGSSVCRKLKYLGLRDDCHADDTAKLLAEVGIPASVETLDLSLGTLGDVGAAALATSAWIKQLKELDIHFHYVSPMVVSELKARVPEVNADDKQEPDSWDGEEHRYVAVGE